MELKCEVERRLIVNQGERNIAGAMTKMEIRIQMRMQ